MTSRTTNKNLRDIILGLQDGLVNILGVVLGVGAATNDQKIILISALAATFAESISMAAVAYTSTEASLNEYLSENNHNSEETQSEVRGIIGNPIKSAFIVGFASLIGSLVPLTPFFFSDSVKTSMLASVVISAILLFAVGYMTSKRTTGSPTKSGLKLTVIGIISAFLGYILGSILGRI